MIIGLTGGIGSGKSIASDILKSYGSSIIDVDLVAREIVRPGTRALSLIEKIFGKDVISQNGELDRKLLGSIVFADSEKLKKLNEITHQDIKIRTKEIIDSLVNIGERVIIVDAALLFEIGLNEFADMVWYIYSSEDVRINRIKERNGLAELDAISRIRTQKECFKNLADEIIINEGSIKELEKSLRSLWIKYIGDKIEKKKNRSSFHYLDRINNICL